MPKITPNLWFDTEAEEAADFYGCRSMSRRTVHSLGRASLPARRRR